MDDVALRSFLASDNCEDDVAESLVALAQATIEIENILCHAPLGGVFEASGKRNNHGEQTRKVDLAAQDLILRALAATNVVVGAVSEEESEPLILDPARNSRGLLVAFDPLDGSSGAAINTPLGTIFSIYRRTAADSSIATDFLQPGTSIICAGYVIYGPFTALVLSYGRGVHVFTLDRKGLEYRLTNASLRLSHRPAVEYSVNHSNEDEWEQRGEGIVNSLRQFGPMRLRYIGTAVADVHRVLLRSGIYMYPASISYPQGRLRLLYEVFPFAFLCEQAGGSATDGVRRILAIEPQHIHERSPLFLGDARYVEAAGHGNQPR